MTMVTSPQDLSDKPLYNTQLINNNIEYIKQFHPDLNIDDFLRYSEITTYQLEDPAHWLTQNQVDRFHEMLLQKTGDLSISRKIGRFAATSKASGLLRKVALGFMTPTSAYWAVQKLTSKMTRGFSFKLRKIGTVGTHIMEV